MRQGDCLNAKSVRLHLVQQKRRRDVEDEKARYQETESGVRQRLSGQF